jgi:hypothetical protein
MPGYVRDAETGRFTDQFTGPPARSFEGFFVEISQRPPTPSGHVLVISDGEAKKVYVEGGYYNIPP